MMVNRWWRRVRVWFAAAAVAPWLAACGGGDCLGGVPVFASAAASAQAECGPASGTVGSIANGKRVTYTVTGTAGVVGVTYSNAQGGTEQTRVTVPWATDFIGDADKFLYFSAQNRGETGSVVVSITIDGTVRKTSTSDGAFVIATVSDRCC